MIGEFIYVLPSDMNLRIGNIRNYNNRILISSPSFKIGTNVKVNIHGEQVKLKDKPDVKSKEVDNQRLMVKSEPDVKQKREPDVIELDKQRLNVKSNIDVKPNIELKHDVKMIRAKPDMNKITIEPSLD